MAEPFAGVLRALNGSRESIQSAADWFEQAPGLAPALAAVLQAHAAELQGPECFVSRLRLVYVANDALFSAQRRASDVCRQTLQQSLPLLLRLAAAAAQDPPSLAKLTTLIDFWASRGVVDGAVAAGLHACVASAAAAPAAAVAAAAAPPLPPPVTGVPPLPMSGVDPSFPVGLIPLLVRRRRAPPYAPLLLEDIAAAAASLPAEDAATQQYLQSRLQKMYADLGGSETHAAPPPPVLGDGSVLARGSGHAGLGTGDPADAFRRARSEAYHQQILSGR